MMLSGISFIKPQSKVGMQLIYRVIFVFVLIGFSTIIAFARQKASSNLPIQTDNQIPRQAELEDITGKSHAIVWGRISRTQSYWQSDERGRHIYTSVTIDPVFSTLGAEVESPLVFEVIGGTIEDITESVTDIPQFNQQEEVIIFLVENPYSLVTGRLSKLNVYNDKVYWSGTAVDVEAFIQMLELIIAGQSPVSIWEQQIQNIELSGVTGKPVISAITPEKASAGTNTQVTITGSNFGDTQGTGKVEFFYKTGESKIAANIISWKDNQIVCTVPVADVDGYPASACSGPVTVSTSGGTSDGKIFRVTFGYGQMKWSSTNPAISYYINENTPDCTGEAGAVQRAAATWNSASSGAVNFQYAGSHTNTAADLYNGKNEIIWGSSGGLATTYILYSRYTGTIIESDTVFNDSYNWSTSGSLSGSQFDVEATALHEMGHWLNLRDLYGNAGDGEYDDDKIMYGIAYGGTTKRTLHSDDITGINWIYPPTVSSPSYIDIGLRVYDGSSKISIACEPQGTLTSPLRIAKNGIIYGIVLVDPYDSNASCIRINTSSGIKAMRKY
jgi:hypothetical protein